MKELKRTQVGEFKIEDSISIEELEEKKEEKEEKENKWYHIFKRKK